MEERKENFKSFNSILDVFGIKEVPDYIKNKTEREILIQRILQNEEKIKLFSLPMDQEGKEEEEKNGVTPTEVYKHETPTQSITSQIPTNTKKPTNITKNVFGLWDYMSSPNFSKDNIYVLLKPARKNQEHFMDTFPKELFCQPFQYHFRVYLPKHLVASKQIQFNLIYPNTEKIVFNTRKESMDPIEVKKKEIFENGDTACVVLTLNFTTCSFHYSGTDFIFTISLTDNETKETKTVFKSTKFHTFARKFNPEKDAPTKRRPSFESNEPPKKLSLPEKEPQKYVQNLQMNGHKKKYKIFLKVINNTQINGSKFLMTLSKPKR